jgi:Tol biopolymer transport system component
MNVLQHGRPMEKRLRSRWGVAGGSTCTRKRSTGTRKSSRFVQDAFNKYPTSWSPDGQHLLYYTGGSTPDTGNDIWVVPLSGSRRPSAFLRTRFSELEARFSPTASGSRMNRPNPDARRFTSCRSPTRFASGKTSAPAPSAPRL